MHKPTPPTVDDRGHETHPAFGYIGASRVTGGNVVLFDSDVTHSQFVRVEIGRMVRERDLNMDWHFPRESLVRVDMSEAQWAAFVSSVNTTGVPCTIRATESEWDVPGLEYAPRLAESTAEVHAAAGKAFGRIQDAMRAVDALDAKAPAKERRAAMDALRHAIAHSTSNVEFAGSQMVEHAEKVVQKARADVEAMVVSRARQLGLPVENAGDVLTLPAAAPREVEQ